MKVVRDHAHLLLHVLVRAFEFLSYCLLTKDRHAISENTTTKAVTIRSLFTDCFATYTQAWHH